MRTRLLAAVAIAFATAPVVVAAAPAAEAAEPCAPSVATLKPYQDPGGFVVFPASYAICDYTRVTVKFRDRDTTSGWAGGSSTMVGPAAGTTYAGTCHPDGKVHRWVAYATLKVPQGGVLITQSAKVYFKSKAVSGNCAPWDPPAT
jgi:hypothetical protein